MMMRGKKFYEQQQQQHCHFNDDYYDHSSSFDIQLRNNQIISSKSNHFTSIRSYLLISFSLFLFLFLTYFILFTSHDSLEKYVNHHRFKRQIFSSNYVQINVKQHYTNMLRRILLHRNTSSVLADCTLNVALEGIYRLPPEKSLSMEIIRLVENNFDKEYQAFHHIARKIRQKINQSTEYFGDFALAKIHDDFSKFIRFLLTIQPNIKEVNIMLATPLSNENNGGSYIYYDTIKYYRLNNDSRETIDDYDSIGDVKLKQNGNLILQTFTPSNARETLKQTIDSNLLNDGWWMGPVLCEKNLNETFLMTYVFPLTNSYFLIGYFNISSVDINQCSNNEQPFGNTHKCPIGTKCIHRPGHGFTLGAYECHCSNPQENISLTIDGYDLEWNETNEDGSLTELINTCQCNPETCHLKSNRLLRTIVIIIHSIFIVFVAILAAIVFQRRKTKIIKHSMWILLELVLFGAALLYASVIADSFGPHGIVCLIMPWLRELGFTIVYGILILRIYKMLAEHQSRKAHCVQVKEKDMLRILFFITISIIGYLLGWTLVNIDHANENISLGNYLLGNGLTLKEQAFFRTCRPRSWDYLVQFAEFVFLCVGIRFIYSTRTAPCEYHERKLITIAIVCEMLFSTLLHVIKDCLWATVDPDALFILSILRCHCTVTCMLILIFCTKLCYIFRLFNDEYTVRDRFRSVPDSGEPTDLITKLHSNGDVEFGELNLRDMDPEEIRSELKRLYTSLHVLKTKTMRKDNPHLTKRHGQRRKNRRFSMQAFQRHGGGTTSTNTGGITGPISNIISGGDKHEHEPTKTPEDSTGSHNEHTHLGGISIHRGSLEENDDAHAHGRTLSDLTSTMASTNFGQRVTFK